MDKLIKKIHKLVKDSDVLFVEDDEHLIDVTLPIFHELFRCVTVARNGKEGLEYFEKQTFDLIITDIKMPVMNGIEMIREIRKKSQNQKIMVVSAYKETDYFIELISLHVKSFILKPFDLKQFLGSIEDCYKNFIDVNKESDIQKVGSLYSAENKIKSFDMIDSVETILVIDDTVDNLLLISDLLNDTYQVKAAKSGEKALEYLQKSENPNLILLDITMPEMDGYEVMERLKRNEKTRDIPVIFLTAKSSIDDEKKGLDLGAEDYITKPISPLILRARVKTQLQNAQIKKFLKNKNDFLELEIEKRTQEILAIQNVSVQVLSSLAETRDQETGNHIKRTQLYVQLLANYLSNNPKFSAYLVPERIKTLYTSAPLHDIGKVGIPDHILLKPGSLTKEEFEIMKTHTTLGKNSIEKAETELGYKVDFLKTAKDIAYLHHEKYDGSGYPLGLKGDNIPISSRLMAIADVYDALISKRVYKEPMSHKKAVEIIKKGRGKHFDPDMTDAFLILNQEFLLIANRFQDTKTTITKKELKVEK